MPTRSSSTRRSSRGVGTRAGGDRAAVDRGVGTKTKKTSVIVWQDCENFVTQIPAFDYTDVGVIPLFPYTNEDMPEIDYLMAYFDQPFMDHLVAETNQYALEFIDSGILPASGLTRWKDTTIEEMYVILALTMMMRHADKHMIQDFWNKDSLIPTSLFYRDMSRDRFLLLLRCLNFENNAKEDRHDGLWKVRKIFSELRGKFRDYFVPVQSVLTDESLILFKGQLTFTQYIPSKRHQMNKSTRAVTRIRTYVREHPRRYLNRLSYDMVVVYSNLHVEMDKIHTASQAAS
ncbi:piggyBac transposable element-derived protein 4-like [Procambarus clarkii]|uniref:piggyBac transposable element-derived protein 4-like n=1 Tax=Procambarus clarkii TaxID=6728 RepID=UPI003742F52B